MTEAKKKSSTTRMLQWILWWQVDQDELRKQVDEYQTLKVWRSARGFSLLLLIFPAVIIPIGIIFFNLLPTAAFVSIFICLLLGNFIYRGHQWAMIGAMLFWSWDKGWQIYEKLQSGSNLGSIWFGLIWWGLYMNAFYYAFRVERLRNEELKEKTIEVVTAMGASEIIKKGTQSTTTPRKAKSPKLWHFKRNWGWYLVLSLSVFAIIMSSALNPPPARKQTPDINEPPQKTAPIFTETIQPPSSLTISELKNGEYFISNFGDKIKLNNGEGTFFDKEDNTRGIVNFDKAVLGELNNGMMGAVISLISVPRGSSHYFTDIAVVINKNGSPYYIGNITDFEEESGQNANITALSIKSKEIIITMLTVGPDDPMCCPSVRKILKYKLSGDTFVKTATK